MLPELDTLNPLPETNVAASHLPGRDASFSSRARFSPGSPPSGRRIHPRSGGTARLTHIEGGC